MNKFKFLKQYKGMFVSAIGLFIVFTFRNSFMFGVGFIVASIGFVLHMRAYIRNIYSDKMRVKNHESDPIKRMLNEKRKNVTTNQK